MSLTLFIYLSVSTAVTLSQGSVLATNTSCPTWFYYDNTTQQCHCGFGLLCSSNKNVEIGDGTCATSAGEEDQYYIANCPLRHTVNNTNRLYSEMPSDPGLLDDVMCGPYNRKGLLCGECIDGYGPTADVLDLKCVNCSKLSEYFSIPLYLVLQLFPVTLFFLAVALFKFNITSGPLLGYVIFCQVYLIRIKANMFMYEYINLSPHLQVTFKISLTFSQFWSLQYVAPVVPPFCISEKLSDIHIQLLSLVPAIYPILLLIVIFIFAYLHAKNCKVIQIIWKQFTIILDKMGIKPVTGDAVIHAFASFIFLSNVAVYVTMGSVTDSIEMRRIDSTPYQHSLYHDPTLEWLSYQHVQYLLIALVPFVFLTVIPSVFHIIYPTRIYGCLSRCISGRKRLVITAFAEALQVCFKDGLNGTRDYRALAGLIQLFPVVVGLLRVVIFKRLIGVGHSMGEAISLVVMCCIMSYIQPCKSAIANISLSLNLFLLGSLCITEHWWISNLYIATETLELIFILIPLMSHILVFVWAGYKLTSYIMRRCGYHSNPRGCRVALVNAVNMCLHRRRRGGYQEMT